MDLVPTVGGHMVPITVYRPLAASLANPVPIILHSHGWSGSRATADDAFHNYIAAGFGVISIDMRGHGQARSTSEARVHHVDFEIQDVLAVIDYAAGLEWVQIDNAATKDPRIGAIGGSYGGGYQLLAAALDPAHRLDAIAPEITWNDLVPSLAPQGNPKSAWVDLLYAAGNAFARVHSTIHQGFVYAETTNSLPDGSVPGTPDLVTQFHASSAANYPAGIDIPTLLVQGMPDTLFNFNQAAANYAQIKATGAPVRLVTHLNGHILNTAGTIGSGAFPIPIGLQPPAGPNPCGKYEDVAIAWFQKYLLGQNVDTGPEVCLALDDESVATGSTYPLPGTAMTTFQGGHVHGPVGSSPLGDRINLGTVDAETVVAGIPTLSGLVTAFPAGGTLYWKLELVDGVSGESRILDSQVTPQVIPAAALDQPFAISLGGIGARIHPGDIVFLNVATENEQFAHNGGRTPTTLGTENLELKLPVVS